MNDIEPKSMEYKQIVDYLKKGAELCLSNPQSKESMRYLNSAEILNYDRIMSLAKEICKITKEHSMGDGVSIEKWLWTIAEKWNEIRFLFFTYGKCLDFLGLYYKGQNKYSVAKKYFELQYKIFRGLEQGPLIRDIVKSAYESLESLKEFDWENNIADKSKEYYLDVLINSDEINEMRQILELNNKFWRDMISESN